MIPQYMKSCTYYISLILLVCLGMVSCTEQNIGEMDQNQYIELTVSCVNLNATRADGSTLPGENAYNENRIETLHYFLYKNEETNKNAVMQGFIDDIDDNDGSYTLQIPMIEGELNNLVFPMPYEECEVYLIANLPTNANGGYDIPQKTDLESLKAMTISTVFQEANPKSGEEFTEQSSFVMDGLGKARIVKRSETIAATGDIQLGRLAAKFTVRISVDDTFTDTNGKKYTPVVDEMRVHLVKASNNTTLEGALGVANFDYKARGRKGSQTVEKKVIDETTQQKKEVNRVMYVFEPFYSYPLSWEYKDENALVLHVMLPWKEEGKDNWERCNYKVFPSTLQLDRNNWYNIDLHIGVLGSFDNEEKYWPEITGDYKVLNWNNGTTNWGIGLSIDTDILGARYLVVEQNEYIVNNKNTFEIPFISSHECTIEGWEVKHSEYKSGEWVETQITSLPVDCLTLEDNKKIKLNHTLNNDFLSTTDNNYDCTPYVFTINLRHEDPNYSSRFKETITIIQKPAICITAERNSDVPERQPNEKYTNGPNSGYQFVNGHKAVHNPSNRGHSDKVKIDGKEHTFPCYGGAMGLTGGTTDPYMYVIEVSVLPEGSDFILGDPRSEIPATNENRQGLDFDSFRLNAPGIEGATARSLTNYYYTKGDESVENMIAPKIRFASSHSSVQEVTNFPYDKAYHRVATYQEDGYLAGRWRFPTWAEMKFVAKLCSDGKMGQLWSDQVRYWCANGLVTATISNGKTTVTLDRNTDATANMRSVRPIYDDWYWEHSDCFRLDESKRGTFTWGDEVE